MTDATLRESRTVPSLAELRAMSQITCPDEHEPGSLAFSVCNQVTISRGALGALCDIAEAAQAIDLVTATKAADDLRIAAAALEALAEGGE